MSTTPSGIRLETPSPLELGKVQAVRSKFERLAEQERRVATGQPPENRPQSRGLSSSTPEPDRGRTATPQPRSRSRPAPHRVGPVSLARATSSNPWRASPPPEGWEDWLPEKAGPKDLDVGIKIPSIRSKTPTAQMLDSKLGEMPDFVLHSRPQSAMSRRPTPSTLRRVSMDSTPACGFSELIAMGTDSTTAEVMRRLEQHQAQHTKPRLSRSPSVASIIPSLPPLTASAFGGPSLALFSTSPPTSRPGSPVPAFLLPDSRRKSSTEGSGSSVPGSIGSSKISDVTTPDGEESPPSSVDAVLDDYPRKRESSRLRGRTRRIPSSPRGQRHSMDLSGAPDIPPIPRSMSINMGGDATTDFYQRSLPHRRPPSRNGYNYSPEAMRSLHGGVMPVIDMSEVRPAIRTRPPVTGRNSTQYNRAMMQQRESGAAQQPGAERQRPVTMSRRASYSSVTGISPTPDLLLQYHQTTAGASTLPRSAGRRVLSLNTVANPSPINENSASSSLAPTSPTGTMTSTPNPSIFLPSPPVRKKVGDFDFVNTLESADRPYTPDEFAVNMAANAKDASRNKGSSKRSVRSLASFMSRHSENEISTNSTAPLTTSSINVLRKENPNARPRESTETEYFDAQDTIHSTASKKAFDKMNADIYMTDLPISTDAHNPPTGDNGDALSISSDVEGERRLRNRPSLFRMLDCTVATPAVSGLSEEIARVSDQIHGGKEPAAAELDTPSSPTHSEKESHKHASFQVPDSSKASTSAESMGQSSEKHKKKSLGSVLREGRVFIRESFNSGLGSAVQNLRARRNTAGSQDKVSVYMAGALPSAKQSKVRLVKGKKKEKGTDGRSSAQINPEEANMSDKSSPNSSGFITPNETVTPSTTATPSVSIQINAMAVNINHQKSVFTEDLKKSELKGVRSSKSRMNSPRGSVASMTWGRGARRSSHDHAINANTSS